MQSLGRVLAHDEGAYDDRFYEPAGTKVDGVRVTPDLAMNLDAVYACTSVIAEDIAKVPFGVYEDLGDKGKQPARGHPIHTLLHDQPNEYQSSLEWREMMTAFALLRGKGISEIRPGRRGPVDQLVPLNPDLVREETSRTGVRRYIYRDALKGGQERTLLPDEVFVVRGRFGKSIIEFAREQVSLDLSMERQARFLFSRGARFQGALTHPRTLSPQARTNLRKALDEYAVNGPSAGRPLLLEEGMTWESVSLTNRDAEFLASRKYSIAQWARRFRVPLHKLQDLDRATNNNIEKQSIEYVTDTLLAWAERWEQSALRDLIVAKERYFAKLNLDALMRGDTLSRYQAYALAVNWGWLTRNEVREMEDRNPIEGLSDPLTPLNMAQGDDPDPGRAQATSGFLRLLAADASSRVVRREIAAMGKLAAKAGTDPAAWVSGVEAFYAEHPPHVAAALHLPEHEARRYAQAQRTRLLAAGPTAMDDWLTERAAELTDLALSQHQGAIAA